MHNYFDAFSNEPEGRFVMSSEPNGSHVYIPNNSGDVMQTYDPSFWMYSSMVTDWVSWGGQNGGGSCSWQLPYVQRAVASGHVSASAQGLYEACVDSAVAGGNPGFMRAQWTGELSCNPWMDSCCTPQGLKPGNKDVRTHAHTHVTCTMLYHTYE